MLHSIYLLFFLSLLFNLLFPLLCPLVRIFEMDSVAFFVAERDEAKWCVLKALCLLTDDDGPVPLLPIDLPPLTHTYCLVKSDEQTNKTTNKRQKKRQWKKALKGHGKDCLAKMNGYCEEEAMAQREMYTQLFMGTGDGYQ